MGYTRASDWYWIDSKGIVYGSARGGIVATPLTDTAYQAFISLGNVATPDPSDDFSAGSSANLDAVLIAAGLGPTGLSVAANRSAIIATAGVACGEIVAAVYAGPTQQAAFSNAAMMVSVNAGAAPSGGAAGTAFSALASIYGVSPSAFAALVSAMQLASLTLETALATLTFAAVAAASNAELATALTTFETSIGSIITSLNSALVTANSPALTAIAAPAAIHINGVSA